MRNWPFGEGRLIRLRVPVVIVGMGIGTTTVILIAVIIHQTTQLGAVVREVKI